MHITDSVRRLIGSARGNARPDRPVHSQRRERKGREEAEEGEEGGRRGTCRAHNLSATRPGQTCGEMHVSNSVRCHVGSSRSNARPDKPVDCQRRERKAGEEAEAEEGEGERPRQAETERTGNQPLVVRAPRAAKALTISSVDLGWRRVASRR